MLRIAAVILCGACLAFGAAPAEAQQPFDDIDQVRVWIDGTPVPPDTADTPYTFEVVADTILTINGYVIERRRLQPLQVSYEATPFEQFRRAVSDSMIASLRAGRPRLEVARTGLRVLRSYPEIVRHATADSFGACLHIEYTDGRRGTWNTPPSSVLQPRPPVTEVLRRLATQYQSLLRRGTTFMFRKGATLTVPETRRANLLQDVQRAAQTPDFQPSRWRSDVLDATFAESVHNRQPLIRVKDQ